MLCCCVLTRAAPRRVGCTKLTLALTVSQSIIHDEVVVRGDLASIKLGKYCTISPGCVLRPAYKMVKGRLVFFSLSMGDNVVVERGKCCERASEPVSSAWFSLTGVVRVRVLLWPCHSVPSCGFVPIGATPLLQTLWWRPP